jgi:hypothetical protein
MKKAINLYDRLKPEVITLIENQKDIYPNTYELINKCLKEQYFFIDLTLHQLHQIVNIEGIRKIMKTEKYEEGFLLTYLHNLLTSTTVIVKVEES